MAATPPFGIPEPEYEAWARGELEHWRAAMLKEPSSLDRAARAVQQRINRAIPERVHQAVTAVIEQLTRGMLTGADLTTAEPLRDAPLSVRDARARAAITAYRTTAAVEGGVAGAGGFWLAAADFPALIAIKIKLLVDIAALYGHDAHNFGVRLWLLHVFQLAFSSPVRRSEVFHLIEDWDARPHPESLDAFDWRTFQQEYRDYIDLAKLAQLIPLVGAPIGAVVNWRLTERLGETAINAARLRWLARS
jgi:hypothetical protein